LVLTPSGKVPHVKEIDAVTSALVLIIGAAVPWVVHLAAPRQRLIALAAAIVVIVLFTLFSSINAVLSWQLWVGVAVGIVTVIGAGYFSGGGDRHASGSRRRSRRRIEDAASEQTGEL
jgi:hypothetical protein